MTPQEQAAAHNICPVCKRNLTDGVMRRVQELSQHGVNGEHKTNTAGLTWITDPKHKNPPFVKIVPLQEIIAEAIGSPFASPKVKVIFDQLCKEGESEFHVLLKLPLPDIEKAALSITSPAFAEKITDGVKKVRAENIVIQPGYDGVFGVVKIWSEETKEIKETKGTKEKEEQIGLGF
jgi:PHP family Zn ribbon phosphoesterase